MTPTGGPPVVSEFPRRVRSIENTWIPLSDGTRLAARVWLPDDADRAPVPAILEYLPYRKRDFTRGRDEPMHHYFAGHGYASIRVDLRGTGASDGLLLDEYLPQEQQDGVEVIAWLAAQPWCAGTVGMIGKSWGGFNALQIAARRPPALGAVISVCASDDRYTDDAHYMGGCLLNENLTWGSVLMAFLACPPDPALVGDRWREMWRARLAALDLLPARWLEHPVRDAYWRQGSVNEDYRAIQCPVYVVGGWADAYTNAVPRLLAGLDVPRKGLVGPWAHLYPHDGVPGPAIGFLQEALRWWDQWLKRVDTGIMREPMYRVWIEGAAVPGRWVAEVAWPSSRIERRPMPVRPAGVTETVSPQTVGRGAGEWCAFGPEDLPDEQAVDDEASIILESAPLGERLEILGAPEVTLAAKVDRPHAFVAVRLSDVAPNGTARRVSYGLLDLAHRDGHDAVTAVEPGRWYRVTLRLNDTAYIFAPAHVIRVAISTAYWPVVWPAPAPVGLAIDPSACTLTLPARRPQELDDALAPFGPPERAPTSEPSGLRIGAPRRAARHDPTTGEHQIRVAAGSDTFLPIESIGLAYSYTIERTFRIRGPDPLSASAEVHQTIRHRREDWATGVTLRTRQTATADGILVRGTLDATWNDHPVTSRTWSIRVPWARPP